MCRTAKTLSFLLMEGMLTHPSVLSSMASRILRAKAFFCLVKMETWLKLGLHPHLRQWAERCRCAFHRHCVLSDSVVNTVAHLPHVEFPTLHWNLVHNNNLARRVLQPVRGVTGSLVVVGLIYSAEPEVCFVWCRARDLNPVALQSFWVGGWHCRCKGLQRHSFVLSCFCRSVLADFLDNFLYMVSHTRFPGGHFDTQSRSQVICFWKLASALKD